MMEFTVTGNLVSAPDVTYLPNGQSVASFRVAVNHRKRTPSGEWAEDGASFMECKAWHGLAVNLAESMRKGDRIIVHGTIRQRTWETKEGEKRSAWTLTADSAGPDLSFATARIARTTRENNGAGSEGADADNAS